MSTQPLGIYRKFAVRRTDGRDAPGGDRAGAEYFVLDLTFCPFARVAAMAYVDAMAGDYPQAAAEMRAKIEALPPGPEARAGGGGVKIADAKPGDVLRGKDGAKWFRLKGDAVVCFHDPNDRTDAEPENFTYQEWTTDDAERFGPFTRLVPEKDAPNAK